MNELECTSLDDYLAGDLPPGDVAAFESHLNGCETCRQAIDDWRSLRGQLQEAARNIKTPPRLAQQIERALPARPRRHQAATRVLAFAASLAACVSLVVFYANKNRPIVVENETNSTNGPSNSGPSTIASAAIVDVPDNVIGVPIDIDDSSVTVVWLYPTDHPEKISN